MAKPAILNYVRGGGDARMVVEYARIGVWHGPWHVAKHDPGPLVKVSQGKRGDPSSARCVDGVRRQRMR